MILTPEQQALLNGEKGETMAKVVKTLVMYGERRIPGRWTKMFPAVFWKTSYSTNSCTAVRLPTKNSWRKWDC